MEVSGLRLATLKINALPVDLARAELRSEEVGRLNSYYRILVSDLSAHRGVHSAGFQKQFAAGFNKRRVCLPSALCGRLQQLWVAGVRTQGIEPRIVRQ